MFKKPEVLALAKRSLWKSFQACSNHKGDGRSCSWPRTISEVIHGSKSPFPKQDRLCLLSHHWALQNFPYRYFSRGQGRARIASWLGRGKGCLYNTLVTNITPINWFPTPLAFSQAGQGSYGQAGWDKVGQRDGVSRTRLSQPQPAAGTQVCVQRGRAKAFAKDIWELGARLCRYTLAQEKKGGLADVKHEVLYSSTQEEQHEKQQHPFPRHALPASLNSSSSGGSRVHSAPNLWPRWQRRWVQSWSTRGRPASATGDDQKQSLGQVGCKHHHGPQDNSPRLATRA